jgi:hypothetical protein
MIDTSRVATDVSDDLRSALDQGEGRRAPGRSAPVVVVAPFLLLGLLLTIVLRYSALDLDNQDTWFHLALGDRFADGWSLREPGALSSFATSSWVPTQWSTELAASAMDSLFGLPGVAWLFGMLMLAFVVTVYLLCRRAGTPLASAVVTGLVVFAAAPALSARPQIVSLLLVAVTVGAWLRSVDDGKPRWWLVPMTWAWATAHGLWSAGVLIGVVCCFGILLDGNVGRRRALRLFAVPALSGLAAAVTPVGPRLLTSQLAVSDRTSMIAEWGPTSFREVPALAAAAMVAWLLVLWARRGRVPWSHVLLVLLACAWILLVTRMVSLGAVVVAPLLAAALSTPQRATSGRAPSERGCEGASTGTVERWLLAALCAVYVAALTVAVPHTARSAEGVPTGLSDRLDRLPDGSVVLVEDGIGGWIEWQHPGVSPVIDGMLDAYPVSYIRDFFDMTELQPGWKSFVSDSRADVAVLRRGSALTAAMQDRLGWRLVQRDGEWVCLVPPARS